jgi:hypothetical protein
MGHHVERIVYIKIVLISFLKGVAKIVNRKRNMNCPKCEKETRQYKIGKTKAGSPEIDIATFEVVVAHLKRNTLDTVLWYAGKPFDSMWTEWE